jgi:hypothetical protein
MAKTDTTNQDDKMVSAQLRGETIAYAFQSGICNLGANFLEPYVGYRTQRYFSEHGGAPKAYGSYTQNLAGEFAGDVIGSATLVGAELLFPQQLHHFMRSARNVVDPLYSSAARSIFSDQKGSPGYEQKMEDWKLFQERNLVRSGIMATASIAGNVATQRWVFANPAPTSAVFKGKLLSTAITTTIGLAVRLAFPARMHAVDQWMGSTMFTPMLSDVPRSAQDIRSQEMHDRAENLKRNPYADPLAR